MRTVSITSPGKYLYTDILGGETFIGITEGIYQNLQVESRLKCRSFSIGVSKLILEKGEFGIVLPLFRSMELNTIEVADPLKFADSNVKIVKFTGKDVLIVTNQFVIVSNPVPLTGEEIAKITELHGISVKVKDVKFPPPIAKKLLPVLAFPPAIR